MSSQLCPQGIPINSDISGPGVRISLYLQSLLTVVLVRVSPEDAPSAYWSMIATALSLIISTIVTGLRREISLLDAIVVTYVLILPIVASAFGVAELVAWQQQTRNQPTMLRRAHSPLLILANWLRSALTYAFALFVWGTAPTFGSGPAECDQHTRLIFFGASLPALRSGRTLNLVGWGVLTALFAWRTLRGSWTLLAAVRGLFSESVLLKPRKPPTNELNLETWDKYNYRTEKSDHEEWAYRPGQVFHEMLQGMMNQILGWAPSGQGRWYRKYGQLILATLIAAWAIAMTELELKLNNLAEDIDKKWGFGQFLPLILTISPIFALFEAVLKKRARGPIESSKRTLRFSIPSATNLKRPQTELDHFTQAQLAEVVKSGQLTQPEIDEILAPSPFAVLSIDGTDLYTTYDMRNTADPDWQETFDARVSDTTTIVVRIFDLKCMDRGWPALIGYTTILPFTVLPPGVSSLPPVIIPSLAPASQPQGTSVSSTLQGEDDAVPPEDAVVAAVPSTTNTSASASSPTHSFPLFRDRTVVPGSSVQFSASVDTDRPLPPSKIPSHYLGLKKVNEKRKVALVKYKERKWGNRETTVTETYNMDNDD